MIFIRIEQYFNFVLQVFHKKLYLDINDTCQIVKQSLFVRSKLYLSITVTTFYE